MSVDDFSIVGLGAIGGSLALDLLATGARVRGYDVDAHNVALARESGVSAELWQGQPLTGDVVVVAVPVRRTASVLSVLAREHSYRLITDLGSTKRLVISAVQRLRLGQYFVGSHPLAGTHDSGWKAARTGMFRDHKVFLCTTSETTDTALQTAHELWHRVGAIVEPISAVEHDARMAWISHLPQLTASALALTMKSGGVARAQVGPGGSDMTRLAGSSAELWLDIAASNADMLDEPLGCLIEALTELRVDLRTGNEDRLLKLFNDSKAWYSAS